MTTAEPATFDVHDTLTGAVVHTGTRDQAGNVAELLDGVTRDGRYRVVAS